VVRYCRLRTVPTLLMRTSSTHRAVSSSKGKDQFFITSIEVSFIEARSFQFCFYKTHFKFWGEVRMISDVSCQIEMKLILYVYSI